MGSTTQYGLNAQTGPAGLAPFSAVLGLDPGGNGLVAGPTGNPYFFHPGQNIRNGVVAAELGWWWWCPLEAAFAGKMTRHFRAETDQNGEKIQPTLPATELGVTVAADLLGHLGGRQSSLRGMPLSDRLRGLRHLLEPIFCHVGDCWPGPGRWLRRPLTNHHPDVWQLRPWGTRCLPHVCPHLGSGTR